jgi:hypothetical protein
MKPLLGFTLIALVILLAQVATFTIELRDRDRWLTSQVENNYALIRDLYIRAELPIKIVVGPPHKTKRLMKPKED